jgi:hypothetical protein
LGLELELEMLLLVVEMQTGMPNRAQQQQQQQRPLRRLLLVPQSPQDQLEHLGRRQTAQQQTAQPPLVLVLVLLPLPLSKVMSSIYLPSALEAKQ